ncbi:ribonucleotide-diphosphate reductase subunit beta [Nicoliella lavandulae]|uniref:Ribonucleotide-diphosphate reductase subunit beta n=1 Tax=Nicoliella lavandulae TaxID=3082954 RepID=A0ABU8SKC9_9LACO
MDYLYYQAINWDQVDDPFDKTIWEQLTTNFWLDIRIPINNDQASWQALDDSEQQNLNQLLASASLSNLLQSEWGTPALRHEIMTQQEESVLNTITFMKTIHAKSCTTIFRNLISNDEAESAFAFADHDEYLQAKADLLLSIYQNGNPLQKKTAFVLAESAATFGEYLPVINHSELSNLNQVIKNILQGSAIFTKYVGYKFRTAINSLAPNQHAIYVEWQEHFIDQLYELESKVLQSQLGDDVEPALLALQDGINYALTQLGFDPRFDLAGHRVPMIDDLMQVDAIAASHKKAVNVVSEQSMDDSDYDF